MSVLLLSGGLDSTVLLADLCAKRDRPLCMTIFYGQKHAKEIEHAEAIADYFHCEQRVVDLSGVFPACPLLGQGDVPEGLAFDAPEQSATVVPGRNAVFVAVAAAQAATHDDKSVWLACHASDEAVYADCRAPFVSLLSEAMTFAYGVRVLAPYVNMTRRQVVARGRELSAPFCLTWSCYNGGEKPCGSCGSCVERADAGA